MHMMVLEVCGIAAELCEHGLHTSEWSSLDSHN